MITNIFGNSGSGKTWFVEKLISELRIDNKCYLDCTSTISGIKQYHKSGGFNDQTLLIFEGDMKDKLIKELLKLPNPIIYTSYNKITGYPNIVNLEMHNNR